MTGPPKTQRAAVGRLEGRTGKAKRPDSSATGLAVAEADVAAIELELEIERVRTDETIGPRRREAALSTLARAWLAAKGAAS